MICSIIVRRPYPGTFIKFTRHQERSLFGLAIYASDFVLVRAAGVVGTLKTETKPQVRLPILSGFGRALQACQQSARGIANRLQHYLFPPAPTGLVTVSDTHRDSEKEMSCVTSLLTGTTKCV